MTLVDIPKEKFSKQLTYFTACPLNMKPELSEKSLRRPFHFFQAQVELKVQGSAEGLEQWHSTDI